MNIALLTAASHSLSAREGLPAQDMAQMWRVETGALRNDSAQPGMTASSAVLRGQMAGA